MSTITQLTENQLEAALTQDDAAMLAALLEEGRTTPSWPLLENAMDKHAERCSLLLLDYWQPSWREQAHATHNRSRLYPLATAVWSEQVFERLLRAGVTFPEGPGKRGQAFMEAASTSTVAGYQRLVGAFFAAGYAEPEDRKAALHSAARFWRVDLLEMLRGMGFRMTSRTPCGTQRGDATLLHEVAVGEPPRGCADHKAALGAVVSYLMDAGVEVNAQTKNGDTALVLPACLSQEYYVHRLRVLLSCGGDPFIRNDRGLAAADLAAQRANVAGLAAMRDAGADLQRSGDHGTTLMHRAAEGPRTLFGTSSPPGEYRAAIAFLMRCGLSLEARDASGRTPVLAATGAADPDRLQALLEMGADPAVTDSAGNDVLASIQHAVAAKVIDQEQAEAMQAVFYAWQARSSMEQLLRGGVASRKRDAPRSAFCNIA